MAQQTVHRLNTVGQWYKAKHSFPYDFYLCPADAVAKPVENLIGTLDAAMFRQARNAYSELKESRKRVFRSAEQHRV